jgi:hypothetical protein
VLFVLTYYSTYAYNTLFYDGCQANADTSGVVDITVTLPTNCSIAATNNNLVKTATPGVPNTIGTAKLKALN